MSECLETVDFIALEIYPLIGVTLCDLKNLDNLYACFQCLLQKCNVFCFYLGCCAVLCSCVSFLFSSALFLLCALQRELLVFVAAW